MNRYIKALGKDDLKELGQINCWMLKLYVRFQVLKTGPMYANST